MRKLLKFSTLSFLVILLAFIQVSAEEDILLELSVGEGDLLMYFVDGDNEYILEPSSISFETSNTSFDPIDVEGTFGVSSQKLRIDNATGGEVELSVALDVSDFEEDAKWIDGENSFLAYSTDGGTGGLVVDPEDVVLIDSGCGEVTNDRTSARFTYLGLEDPGNVTSIDVLNSSGGNYCRFDLTNLKLIQTIPPRTSSGDYSIGMVLTITGGNWLPGYTLSYTAGDNGIILGESIQTVSHGSNGSSVEAVPDQGYVFIDWSDGLTENPRMDTNVTDDISVTANFAEEDCSQMDIGEECGGGIVAYHDGTGGGLIAAVGDYEAQRQWGCGGTLINTSTDYGSGSNNTDLILSNCATRPIAASVVRAYDGGGYEDWFLPSRDELDILYQNRDAIGGFVVEGSVASRYWSSSESSDTSAIRQSFSDGSKGSTLKSSSFLLRAVRAF
jgi:hypothetical protein